MTFPNTQGFQFTAVPGGPANDALFKSGRSMKSIVPVTLTILCKFLV